MVSYLQEQPLANRERGDKEKVVELPGRRVTTSRSFSARSRTPAVWGRRLFGSGPNHAGFTLIELVITITVLTILTLGVVPLLKLSVKRQKEEQLRAVLRQMRTAIDEFHRDTVGMPRMGVTTGQPPPPPVYIDPRSKVVISDPTIFGVDNPDLYPPDLETLVNGVNVIPRAGAMDGRGDPRRPATEVGGELATKKKVYLREIPINPFTGGNEIGKDWELRSCYDDPNTSSWGGENVFDVIFPPSKDQYFKPMKAGDKYSDW